MPTEEDLVYRLRKRAEIRRSIPRNDKHGRDRISDILEEAADEIERMRTAILPFVNADGSPRTTFEYDDDPAVWERLAAIVKPTGDL